MTRLAIIQRKNIVTDADWQELDSAYTLLRQLSERNIICLLIWGGTSVAKNGRIEDVFKPFSKLAVRLKEQDVSLSGAIFIDTQGSSLETQLEPKGAAIATALSQYDIELDDVIFIATETSYVKAAEALNITRFEPSHLDNWLNNNNDQ